MMPIKKNLKNFKSIFFLSISLIFPSIVLAKPIYLTCNYNAHIICGKNTLCDRPGNSKQIENTLFDLDYKEYLSNGISYYVIYKGKLFDAKYFSKENKKLESIADQFVRRSGGKYDDDSTYEYVYISMQNTKSNYSKTYYINRINGEYYSSVSLDYTDGSSESTYKLGQCNPIKYSRKF